MSEVRTMRQLIASWPDILGSCVGFCVKWFFAGMMFHMGWKVLGYDIVMGVTKSVIPFNGS